MEIIYMNSIIIGGGGGQAYDTVTHPPTNRGIKIN